MKKIITRSLCAILMLAMLVPMFGIMASAADLVNLYDQSKAKLGTPGSSRDAALDASNNFYTTHAIEVKAGDVVTLAPVVTGQPYYIRAYDETGSVTISKVTYADCVKVDSFTANVEIVQWTVPEGTASIRFATNQLFGDCTVLTINQTFTTADYFAYMADKNVNLDFIRPTNASEALVNVFPKSDQVFAGRVDKTNKEIASGSYRTSPAIPVKEGDILYFGGAVLSQGYQLVLLDKDGKGTTTVNSNYMVLYDDFGDGNGVYAYKMRPGTAFVRIVAATAVYDADKQLVTINQPFTAEGYNNYFNPPVETEPAPETTEPAPETTAPETTEPGTSTPTGDSAFVFAAIAMISLAGVAVIAKRREN